MGLRGPQKDNGPLGDPSDKFGFQNALDAHLEYLRVRNFSPKTINKREKYLRRFIVWCLERDITRPSEVTKPILERFQRHIYHLRNAEGKGLSVGSQFDWLSQLKGYFKWLCKMNYILFNPASEIEMPRTMHQLPKFILTADEAERVLAQAPIGSPLGLRDRTMMEILYSSGLRRFEVTELTIYSIDYERKTLMVRQGKYKKDRLVPISPRAIQWVQRYMQDARPELAIDPNEKTLFLSVNGLPLEPNSFSEAVRDYINQAEIGKKGSCHLFRHTLATLMLENGADIRYVQAMLGHANIQTTEVYTQVAIKKLQKVHELTHPANQAGGSQAGGERPEAGGKPSDSQSESREPLSSEPQCDSTELDSTDSQSESKAEGPTSQSKPDSLGESQREAAVKKYRRGRD
jgi:integrase/recombinase XerD